MTLRLIAVFLALSTGALAQTVPSISSVPRSGHNVTSYRQDGTPVYGPPVSTLQDLLPLFGSKSDVSSLSNVDNVGARGADLSGQLSATAALQASQATLKTVYLPTGDYHVTDTLTLAPGQCLIGDGRTRSVIHVKSDFNPAAGAVIVAASTEPGACIRDVGMTFDQPASQSSRAAFKTLAQACTTFAGGSGCKYPPAIIAPGAARAQFVRVRVSGAWDGFILTGNVGGLLAENLEVGALDVGLQVNGGLDFCHVSGYHFWPFGLDQGAIQSGVFTDGQTVAANLGRCDGWDIRGFNSYVGAVNILPSATQVLFSNLELDGDHANLNVADGSVKVTGFYSTKGSPSDSAITVSGGSLQLDDWELLGTVAAPAISVTGGTTRLGMGHLTQLHLAYPAISQTGGRLYVDGVTMSPAPGIHSVPFINANGPAFQLRNSTWDRQDSYTNTAGIALTVIGDSPANFVANNDFGGWDYVLASGAILGIYGPNKVGVFGFTPQITPQTPGTWAPVYGLQNGRYWYRGDGIEFEIHLVFNTNAYSGASGPITITGLPFSVVPNSAAAQDQSTAQMTAQSKVVYSAGFTSLAVKTASPPTYVSLYQVGSSAGISNLTTSSFPPSVAAYELNIQGFIPTN